MKSSLSDIFTQNQTFQDHELPALMEMMRGKHPNCKIQIKAKGRRNTQRLTVIFQGGKLAYCNTRPLSLDNFVSLIHHKIDNDWIDLILESTQIDINAEMAPKHFCDKLLQMRVISKPNLFKTLLSSYLLILETFWSGSGDLNITPIPNQGNLPTIDWKIIKDSLEKRQSIWQKLPSLTHGVNSIPIISEAGIEALQGSFAQESNEEKLATFIQSTIDGRSYIGSLARKRNVDPLSLGKLISQGIAKGWLSISEAAYDPSISKQRNILVVDNTPTTRKLLVTILHEFYNAIETTDTLSAVSLIPNNQIDLVILSHSVPLKAGLQLCRTIRKNPVHQRMPILFVSSKENFFDRVKAKMAGVTDYITQPFSRNNLFYTLDHYLR